MIGSDYVVIMDRYKHSGWFNESVRHSLARKGIKTRISLQGISGFSPAYTPGFAPMPSQRVRVPVANWLKGRKGDSPGHSDAARGITKGERKLINEGLMPEPPMKKPEKSKVYALKPVPEQVSAPKEEIAPVAEEALGVIEQQAQPVEGGLPLKEEVPSTIIPKTSEFMPAPATYMPQVKIRKPKEKVRGFPMIPPSYDPDIPISLEEHREEFNYG
jgi:hypothetical protein